jgi:flagellar hook-associated protein 2
MNIMNNPIGLSGAATRTATPSGTARTSEQTKAGSGVLQGIDQSIARDTARLSALGRITSLMDGVSTAVRSLTANGFEAGVKSSSQVLTATLAAAQSNAGSYTIQIGQLAQAQQLTSPPLARSDVPLGAGAAAMIRIDMGTQGAPGHTTRLVKIDAGNDTLDDIAAAIKATGIDAAVVKGQQGYQLQISGESGAAHAMLISVIGDPAIGARLSWPTGGKGGMKQTQAGQDAVLTVDGKPLQSASNTVGNAIPGVELKLQATGVSQVTVSRGPRSIADNAKAFVAQLNQLNSQLSAMNSGDAATDKLAGQIRQQLTQAMGKIDPDALAGVGITNHNGVLQLDDKTFDAAVAADPDRVASLFSKAGHGLADLVGTQLVQGTSIGGIVGAASASMSRELDQLGDKRDAFVQLQQRQAALLAQQYANASNGSYGMSGLAGVSTRMSLFDYI